MAPSQSGCWIQISKYKKNSRGEQINIYKYYSLAFVLFGHQLPVQLNVLCTCLPCQRPVHSFVLVLTLRDTFLCPSPNLTTSSWATTKPLITQFTLFLKCCHIFLMRQKSVHRTHTWMLLAWLSSAFILKKQEKWVVPMATCLLLQKSNTAQVLSHWKKCTLQFKAKGWYFYHYFRLLWHLLSSWEITVLH